MKEVLTFLIIGVPTILFLSWAVMDIMGAFKVPESHNYKSHKN